jgi:protein gp37
MGKESSISWTHATFNAWWGCVEVGGSPACGGPEFGGECYAKTWDRRCGGDHWGNDKDRRFFGDKHWNEPLVWNRAAEKAGEMRRVFCMSMGDWAEGRPDQQPYLERLWDLILETRSLNWLMLTKRPQLIAKLCPLRSQRVWQGVTAENQYWFDLRWQHLRQVDAEVYWLSMEPLFERVKLADDFLALGKRAWVIVGGQSGKGAQPFDADTARYMRDQCRDAGVPFHFKQGSSANWEHFKMFDSFPDDLKIREYPMPGGSNG